MSYVQGVSFDFIYAQKGLTHVWLIGYVQIYLEGYFALIYIDIACKDVFRRNESGPLYQFISNAKSEKGRL